MQYAHCSLKKHFHIQLQVCESYHIRQSSQSQVQNRRSLSYRQEQKIYSMAKKTIFFYYKIKYKIDFYYFKTDVLSPLNLDELILANVHTPQHPLFVGRYLISD